MILHVICYQYTVYNQTLHDVSSDRFVGPYIIREVLPKGAFLLRDDKGKDLAQKVNASSLRRFINPIRPPAASLSESPRQRSTPPPSSASLPVDVSFEDGKGERLLKQSRGVKRQMKPAATKKKPHP